MDIAKWEEERDSSPIAKDIIKSDDYIVQPQKSGPEDKTKEPGWFIKTAYFWNVFELAPDVQQPSDWRYKYGFWLTFIYLVGMMVIIGLYYRSTVKEGRPIKIHFKYASPKDVVDGSIDNFICKCDFPAQVQSVVGNDTRIKNFNRCYDPAELRSELDILHYLPDSTSVDDLIQDITKKASSTREHSGFSLAWTSYELTTPADRDPLDTSDGAPLANLARELHNEGYVEALDASISVQDLASPSNAFAYVPQGFVTARVHYSCSVDNCVPCQELWAAFNSTQATETGSWDDSYLVSGGWAFCAQEPSNPLPTENCRGFCRFFRTQDRPWGILLHEFAKQLEEIIADPATNITFHSRILYANISRVDEGAKYNLSSLEVDRTGTVWARLQEWYGQIALCGQEEDFTPICSGTSICGFAPVYDLYNRNSEFLHVACMNYPTGTDFTINRTECENIVTELGLTFPMNRSDNVHDRLCGDFRCRNVQSTQIQREALKGERALNNLIRTPSVRSSFVPGICISNYTQVLQRYERRIEDGEELEMLLSIHEMNCTTGNSGVCWLTGKYKNMTSTWNESWNNYHFSSEEIKSGDRMFACYRFDSESKMNWLYDVFGNVSGVIGSWLLLLSCFFWFATRPHHPIPSKLASIRSSGVSANAIMSPEKHEIKIPRPWVEHSTFEVEASDRNQR